MSFFRNYYSTQPTNPTPTAHVIDMRTEEVDEDYLNLCSPHTAEEQKTSEKTPLLAEEAVVAPPKSRTSTKARNNSPTSMHKDFEQALRVIARIHSPHLQIAYIPETRKHARQEKKLTTHREFD